MNDVLQNDYPEGSTLHACGPEGCMALAAYWTESNFAARAVVVSESDTDDDVFFVVQGTARAATFTDNGREVLYSDLPRGEAFGIFAAIDGKPRSTNVFAKEPSRIARMSAKHFRDVLYGNRDVNRAFLLYLVDRIRYLSSRMTEATTLSGPRDSIEVTPTELSPTCAGSWPVAMKNAARMLA